jgi:hypothetical protein
MELISCILISIDGKFESLVNNIVFIFGFSSQELPEKYLTKDEFFFFLDCLFRGILSLVAPPLLFTDNKKLR